MLTAFYDLASSPPTYDFVSFLVSAERERLRLGETNVAFVIVPGPDHGFRRDQLPPRDPEARVRMRDHIVAPMCGLLPSSAGVTVCETRDQAETIRAGSAHVFPEGWMPGNKASHYGLLHMVEAWRAGVFPLRATTRMNLARTVTITLREAHYWPARNSNRAAWIAVADWLRGHGFDPLFIPDAESIDLEDLRHRFDRSAATDLHRRAAIYEAADYNLFVSNGPVCVAAFMRAAPLMVFKMIAPDAPCTDAGFFRQCGLPVGSQIGRAAHRIVWADDAADIIIPELESMLVSP